MKRKHCGAQSAGQPITQTDIAGESTAPRAKLFFFFFNAH